MALALALAEDAAVAEADEAGADEAGAEAEEAGAEPATAPEVVVQTVEQLVMVARVVSQMVRVAPSTTEVELPVVMAVTLTEEASVAEAP